MARTADEAFRHTAYVAQGAGLTLLGAQWSGANANYRFRCSVGHEFERRASVVTRGSTACPLCARAATRQRFFDLLERRGIVCLENDYLGLTVRHRLQCAQGHRWEAEGRRVMEGCGCATCANAQVAAMNTHADGLERLREAATRHGGRCLTDIYSGIVADYEWECANGHRWHARGNNVVRGGWCRICFGLRHSDRMIDPNGLIRLQTAAALQGGQCLDSDYEGANRRYRFRCAAGHEWQTAGSHVLSGGWCPRCAEQRRAEANRVPDGLAQLQAAAESHGGQLLDADYTGIAAHYTFRCAKGHQWTTRGRGCWGAAGASAARDCAGDIRSKPCGRSRARVAVVA